MRYIILVVILMSCKSKKEYLDVLSKPKDTQLDQYKRVIKTDGKENQKRYLYYNSIQFKNKYKREN